MLDFLTSFEGSMVAKWLALFITVAPLFYMHILAGRSGFGVTGLLRMGLALLVARATLDLGESYDALGTVPVIGAADPLHSLYETLSGLVGLVLLTAGAYVEAIKHARERQELDKEKQLREAVLSLLDAGILVTDKQQQVVYLNPKAAEVLTSTGGQREISSVQQHFEGELNAGAALPNGAQLYRLDSKTFQVTEQEIQGGKPGQQLTVQAWWDVTQWEQGKRLSQEFVSAVSHEFRTPLTSVKGYLELALKDPGLSDKVRGYLQVVRANTERLILVVEDLLDLSRIEAGVVQLDLQKYPIRPLVMEALSYFEKDFTEKELEISTSIPSEELEVYADRERLLQVIANLLSNAYKYTPKGGKVTVGVEDRGNSVAVQVADTGIGMQEEEQAHIFTRFYRTTDARLLRIQGVGLGLVITKSLIEALGGSIWFESTYGQGSTFCIAIPNAAPEEAVSAPLSQSSSQVH